MIQENKSFFLACAGFLFVLVLAPQCQETNWFTRLVAAADQDRAVESALDTSTLGSTNTGIQWSTGLSAPLAVDANLGSLNFDPYAVVQLSSPSKIQSAFNWKTGIGVGASLSRELAAKPLLFTLGPILAMEMNLRFIGKETSSASPSERLRAIELGGRLRDNERTATNLIFEAANLAALSAVSLSDALYAESQAAFLEKKARRIEIDMGQGRSSRADFSEASDAFAKAGLDAQNYRYLAESYGRQARLYARLPIPGGSATFSAKDLYSIGLSVANCIAAADPTTTAIANATAPWELRLAELGLEALSDSPLLTLQGRLLIAPPAGGTTLSPSGSGNLGLSIPLNSSASDRSAKTAKLTERRDQASESASSLASLRFAEARRAITLVNGRITSLASMAAERKTRLESWTRLEASHSATILDVLAATSSLAEAQSALDRSKADYFLSSVKAFTESGLSVSVLLTAFTQTGKAVSNP